MALPGGRTDPDPVAVRSLLKPGRKWEEAVKALGIPGLASYVDTN
jgi:hypothetical protein